MSSFASQLRSAAVSVAVAAGAILFAAAPVVAQTAQPTLVPGAPLPTLAPMLEHVTPAIVNIAVVSRSSVENNPLYSDPFFRRYFNLPDQLPQQKMSAGSGVIIDAGKGYVLTNHHVVEGGNEITVTLKDRRQFPAKLVGSDKETDIALLQIKPENLTAIEIGDSASLKVGDYVVAIGNPFGLGQTVTSGIVSALGRSGLNIEGYEDFIQTDASINPGNSGGALVTLDGRLVGINTAILAPSGGNVGIGFAVPSSMARAVADQLIAHGQVRRGRLGVAVQDLTPDLAEALGVSGLSGAVVSSVEPNSPAARAGLKASDVIVALDGRPVSGATDLRNRIGLMPAGTTVQVTVRRGSEEKTFAVTIEAGSDTRLGTAGTLLEGAEFRDLTQEEAGKLEIKGAAVARVKSDSAAARAGLREGDIILAVNRMPVSSAEEVSRAVSAAKGTLALDLIRDGVAMLLVVRG